MKLSRIVLMGMLALLLMVAGEARANAVWQYSGVCDPSLYPGHVDIMCSAGNHVYIDAVVSDAYVPGTTINFPHPDLISLTYRDAQFSQVVRDLYNIELPVFDLLQTCLPGVLTLPSRSVPGRVAAGCSAWSLTTTTSDFWFSQELSYPREPDGYVAYGPAGVWKRISGQVPEPATISLFGFAVLAAAMFGARRLQRRGDDYTSVQ